MSNTSEPLFALNDVYEWAKEEAAIEGPDFIYKAYERDSYGRTTCRYVENGQPSCIIGRMLSRQGLLPVFPEDSYENTLCVSSLLTENDLSRRFTLGARGFMSLLQLSQDRGMPWGEAIERAMKAH